MKSLKFALSMLFVAGAAGCHCMHHEKSSDGMTLEAQKLDKQFVDAFNRADVDGVMKCYWKSPELIVFPPDALEAKGYDAVRDGFAGTFRAMPGAQLELLNRYYNVSDGVIFGYGTFRITMPATTPGLTPPEMRGRYTEVIAKRDGQWVYVLDHPSMPVAFPAATQPAK